MNQGNKISLVFVTYNSRNDFDDCFKSLERQTYRDYEVIISDNGSTDGSVDYLKANYPDFIISENGRNIGYGAGNNVGFRLGTGDYFVVLNTDVELEDTFLERMLEGLKCDPDARIATPKILLFNDRNRVNCAGNAVHFTGMTFCNGIMRESSDYCQNLYPNNFSGAAFMISRDWLEQLGGGFDEDFAAAFTGETWKGSLEDVDMSFRTQLLGHKIICVTSAVMYHKYEVNFDAKKMFYLECGRYILIMKNYPARVLMFFAPGLLFMEMVVLGYAIVGGKDILLAKLGTYSWLIKNWRRLKLKRAEYRDLLQSGQTGFFRSLSYKIVTEELMKKTILLKLAKGLINTVFYLLFPRWVFSSVRTKK